MEYLKALLRLESPIKPCGLPRDLSLKSASQLRADLDNPSWRKHVPSALLPLYDSVPKYRFVWGERAVLARLRSLSEQEFEMLPYGTEGLWRKFLVACRTQPDCEHILSATRSKRYPRTRLQRMLLCAYLGIDCATLEAAPPYVRLLGLTSRGRQVLRQAKVGYARLDQCRCTAAGPGLWPFGAARRRSLHAFLRPNAQYRLWDRAAGSNFNSQIN